MNPGFDYKTALKEYNWGEIPEVPLTWTTEDFKAMALSINAAAQFRDIDE